MSKVSHTPGPWVVVDGYYPSIKEISGPSFKVSAVMWATDLTETDYQKRNADLHLIAAAPYLLETLEQIAMAADATVCNPEWIAKHARAAIAKVLGEQA
jgi:hypothetical protein